MNEDLQSVILGCTLRGTVVIALALVCGPSLRRLFGRNGSHWLWLAALAVLLWPVPPHTPLSLQNLWPVTRKAPPVAAARREGTQGTQGTEGTEATEALGASFTRVEPWMFRSVRISRRHDPSFRPCPQKLQKRCRESHCVGPPHLAWGCVCHAHAAHLALEPHASDAARCPAGGGCAGRTNSGRVWLVAACELVRYLHGPGAGPLRDLPGAHSSS